MYIPAHFRQDDLPQLQQFIQAHSFATIVTLQDGQLVANHVPLTYLPEQGEFGTLCGHYALGNTHWRTFDGTREALVIFQGPHAYISPKWYKEPSKSVPTWNYTVVHAYGTPRFLEQKELWQHLMDLQQKFEGKREQPWTFEPENEFIQRLTHGIVGFAIPIARIEGKYKLNQNRTPYDQAGVIQGLRTVPDHSAQEIADMMQENLDKRK